MSDEKSVELYRKDGEAFRSVRASVRKDAFLIETQDMGRLVEEVWGDSDYEFWTSVPREAWGQLLRALAIEFFANDPRATDRLRDICMTHGVAHKWDNWA